MVRLQFEMGTRKFRWCTRYKISNG
uniref:Uncharacterized protein n=1 Tax=Romanomermis culicivorax TaxID=13658 RepID=A0A915K281_ROMCU